MPQRVASPGDDSQRERTVAATVVGRRLVGRVLNATIVMGAIGRRVKARSVSSTGWASVGVCNLLSTDDPQPELSDTQAKQWYNQFFDEDQKILLELAETADALEIKRLSHIARQRLLDGTTPKNN
ncbi:GL20227 [Drosophila persimilis]|uniref:GL20227 n=1 Tax=Drosophila persimilis TaxID=7234 RepID=B4GXQ1_DROPE|nr:GL20227 [Drosophila persimilis]